VRAFTAADISDAIDLRSVLEGLAARRVAELGAPKALLRELRDCLDDGDAILGKRHISENDEAAYVEMNTRFHNALIRQVSSVLLADSLERISRVPFGGAQALAFNKDNLGQMYDMLSYAHRQHHAVVDAIERGQGARAEALMREHANAVRESIDLAGVPVATADSTGRFALTR
jgi:GntR family transcriptional regulator of vanillate catabolism